MSNVTLCEELLVELDKPGRTIVWVEIPSHVGLCVGFTSESRQTGQPTLSLAAAWPPTM